MISGGIAPTRDGFREDINGLRAWAVLGVVLYHFGIPGFAGGFVGVDVFFVISGFLMAGIVVGDLEKKRFNLFDFYVARARRIVPALLVVVLFVLVLGWFILMPSDYKALGRHARESVFFTSNIRYLAEAGYFDKSAHEKWLLHTWSLSVEWQFYLLYPVVLVFLRKILSGRRAIFIAHLVFFVISLGVSVSLVGSDPSRAFFLLPSRAWELILGGMVFLLGQKSLPGPRGRSAIESFGFGLMLLAMLGLDASWRWPGALALLPTLGAALIIAAASQTSRWTTNAPAQWLGTRSYSIYLWHWPLVVWLTYYDHQRDVAWVSGALLLCLLIGDFSYRFVEVPVRRWLTNRGHTPSLGWLLVLVVIVAGCAHLVRKGEFLDRLPNLVVRLEAETLNRDPMRKKCFRADAECVYGGPNVAAILIGDSHSNAVINAVVGSLPDSNFGINYRGTGGCLMVEGAILAGGVKDNGCIKMREKLFSSISDIYPGKPLIVINRTSAYALGELDIPGVKNPGVPMAYFSRPHATPDKDFLDEFRRKYVGTACLLAKNHPLYLVRPFPEMPVSVPQTLGKIVMRGMKRDDVFISRDEYRRRNSFIWDVQDEAAASCGAKILDPLPYLCSAEKCFGSMNFWPLYFDWNHLSQHGANFLVPMFSKIFD